MDYSLLFIKARNPDHHENNLIEELKENDSNPMTNSQNTKPPGSSSNPATPSL
jgi:hypothetical protein